MEINWSLVNSVVPFVVLFLSIISRKLLERRVNVAFYLSHVSAFKLRDTKNDVFSHSVTVYNSGKKTAKNVRVGHNILPRDYMVFPINKVYDEKEAPGGGKNIVFPTLVHKETVTISYLYSPPVTYEKVNSQVAHDDGFAKPIPVLISKQYPKWQLRVLGFFTLLGIVAFIYLVIFFIRIIFKTG